LRPHVGVIILHNIPHKFRTKDGRVNALSWLGSSVEPRIYVKSLLFSFFAWPVASLFTHKHHLSLQRPLKSRIMPPYQTPYVTPHILHKNYAQAHDAEAFGNSELTAALYMYGKKLTVAHSDRA
jgi:hypothetical protein